MKCEPASKAASSRANWQDYSQSRWLEAASLAAKMAAATFSDGLLALGAG